MTTTAIILKNMFFEQIQLPFQSSWITINVRREPINIKWFGRERRRRLLKMRNGIFFFWTEKKYNWKKKSVGGPIYHQDKIMKSSTQSTTTVDHYYKLLYGDTSYKEFFDLFFNTNLISKKPTIINFSRFHGELC